MGEPKDTSLVPFSQLDRRGSAVAAPEEGKIASSQTHEPHVYCR
ncbi:MAG: hypothetical protein OZSIB_2589 [Candidatus Ozemobacter sibiricus]|uniref:Uncharacterized protein n=1 Tax=Candidatus Ozemobacter sibiricus TaxID=2268124 RepID=A0A367ZIH7_9BACT|nr:MAG: hypothetical protein OZSIB_2589 [Candidatus Ozemobacter sibiricus]